MKESLGATIKSQLGVVRVVVGFAGAVVADPINHDLSVGTMSKGLALLNPFQQSLQTIGHSSDTACTSGVPRGVYIMF